MNSLININRCRCLANISDCTDLYNFFILAFQTVASEFTTTTSTIATTTKLTTTTGGYLSLSG